MITGIVIALPEEISTLTKQKINKGEYLSLNDQTLLAFSGAGPENATHASQLLIKNGAKRLISWGCAGALKSNLKPGDLILPQILHSESNQQFSVTSTWFQHTLEELSTLNPNTGSLAESSSIVAKSIDKKTLHKQSRAIAVDMESVAVARIAIQNNLPVLVIRCIADPLAMDFPYAVSYALNSDGDVVLAKLLWYLLTHPKELPSLIKLGLHFNTAKNKLKLVAKHLDTIVGFDQDIAIK